MKSFETVLSIISFKIRLVEGAVRRLYTIEGAILNGPEEITDGGQYVACGHRRFVIAPYGEMGSQAKASKLPSIRKRGDLSKQSPRTQSNPLPAIQKKNENKKARSEKDSPAPIEEDKVGGLEDEEDEISRTEINTVSKKNTLRKKSNQAMSSDDLKSVPSKSKLDRTAPKRSSNAELLAESGKDAVFNASDGKKTANTEGKFLMDNAGQSVNQNGKPEDEVEEDTNLVEDKPIGLQKAEEVPDA